MFDEVWERYQTARNTVKQATKDSEIEAAYSEERAAIFALVAEPARTIFDILKKRTALWDAIVVGGTSWADMRHQLLFDSVTRDLAALTNIALDMTSVILA